MGIKLTTEVKEVIHQMIAITKEFEPGMMNTLVLFDALLLNRLFAGEELPPPIHLTICVLGGGGHPVMADGQADVVFPQRPLQDLSGSIPDWFPEAPWRSG